MAKKSTSTALVKIQNMVADIERNYLGSGEEAIAQMAESILQAETFEQMFEESTVPEKLFDVQLKVTEIHYNRSSFGGGIPYFATFEGVRADTDEEFLFNCSGWQPVVVAYKCLTENWLPRNLIFHKADKPTASGFFPITVAPAEEPF